MNAKDMAVIGLLVSAMILALCTMATLPAAAQEPPTPFKIYGEINDSNGAPVLNPNVTVTNLNTSEVFTAKTNESSNYYRLVLDNSSAVKNGDKLRLTAKKELGNGPYNPTNYTYSINVTDYNVTAVEANAGGLFGSNLSLNHYCINYYPDYPYHIQAKWNYSGAAVMKMWSDFKNKTTGSPRIYEQDELQTLGLENNTQADKDAGLQHIDPRGMANTLKGIIDLPPGHTFTVGVMPNTTEGLSWAMHRICWWQYTGPGALPTDGYYADWMSVRGIHTNKSPHAPGTSYGGDWADWGYDVHGFWINDPHNESLQGSGGIGANSYKTAAEWTKTYYKEIIDSNNTQYPYNWNHKYITVLEPPERDADVRIVPAKPRLDRAITPVMIQKTLIVNGIEKAVLVETAEDEDALDVVGAAIDGVTDELIPYDPAFVAVFAKTVAGEPMLVTSDNGDYYLVPFDLPVRKRPVPIKKPVVIQKFDIDIDGETVKLLRAVEGIAVIEPIPIEPIQIKEEKTLVVVRVDTDDGSFKEASWVDGPVKYLPVSKEEALELVFDEIYETQIQVYPGKRPLPQIELVHRDSSPYYPDWKITIGSSVYFVNQKGELFDVDADGDGYLINEGDCDDNNAAVYPGAAELCDGLDNDCDRVVDEGCPAPTLTPKLTPKPTPTLIPRPPLLGPWALIPI